jgi:hypothetical protein
MVVRECAKTVAAIGAMAAARTTNIAAEIVAEIILLNMTSPESELPGRIKHYAS